MIRMRRRSRTLVAAALALSILSMAPTAWAQADTTRPGLVRITIEGWAILLNYDEDLDSESTPPTTAFALTVTPVGGAAGQAAVSRIDVFSHYVLVQLATSVVRTDAVTVTYFGSNPPIQDGAGNDAAPFAGGSAINNTDAVPSAPGNLRATPDHRRVTLEWSPASTYGRSLERYEYAVDGGDWKNAGTDLTETVGGLENGTPYDFSVRALNWVGAGPAATVTATPVADPTQADNRTSQPDPDPSDPSAGTSEPSTGDDPAGPPPVALDFTHFANGQSIRSELVLVNVGSGPARPEICFYDAGGDPVAAETLVDLTDDLEIRTERGLTVRRPLPPLAMYRLSTHGRGGLVTGSVRVLSDGPIGGSLRYVDPVVGVAAVEPGRPVHDVVFPVRRRADGPNTGVALHNLEAEPLALGCRLMGSGAVLAEAEISLEANGQGSWAIDAAFPDVDTSDFTGSVRCRAPRTQRFTAIALLMDAAARTFVPLPVVPVRRDGGGGRDTVLDFAHFANGTGITSEVLFINPSIEPSAPLRSPFHTFIPPTVPVLYFFDPHGDPIPAESLVDLTADLHVRADGGLTLAAAMDPLGLYAVATNGRGDLVTGSVRVVSEGPVSGVLRYDLPDVGVGVVGASPPVHDAVFPVRRAGDGGNTGVAIHNLDAASSLVRCELMKDGAPLSAPVTIPLEPNGQTSWVLDAAFPDADMPDVMGAMHCSAAGDRPFSTLALEMNPDERLVVTLHAWPVDAGWSP